MQWPWSYEKKGDMHIRLNLTIFLYMVIVYHSFQTDCNSRPHAVGKNMHG
jgi:hypothetical protein